MHKSAWIVSAVAATLLTCAQAKDYEVTPLLGGVWPEGNLGLETEGTVGAEFQFNNIFQTIKPEIMVLFSPDAAYEDSSDTTTIGRFMVNGVYEYGALGDAVPFVKAGLGYENMTKDLYDNEDSVMADAGVGLKLPLTETIALKLEALYMLKYNADRWDNNLAGLAGLTFSFGGSDEVQEEVVEEVLVEEVVVVDSDGDGVSDAYDRCPGTPAGAAVDANGCQPDGDGDGVADAADRCPNSAAGVAVDAEGCELDSDSDGVVDSADRCPGTPKGFKVDNTGCPVVKSLQLTFETASAKIAPASEAEVASFAAFLNESPAYNVKVVGHTDNTGAAAFNQKLSEKRAQSVKTMLVADGVAGERITTEGRGESEPVADNGTAEGRSANRRIEVWLLK